MDQTMPCDGAVEQEASPLPPTPYYPAATRQDASKLPDRLEQLHRFLALYDEDPTLAMEVLKTQQHLGIDIGQKVTSDHVQPPLTDRTAESAVSCASASPTDGNEAGIERLSAMGRRAAHFPFNVLLQAERCCGISVHDMQGSLSDLQRSIEETRQSIRRMERDVAKWELLRHHGERVGVRQVAESIDVRRERQTLVEHAMNQQLEVVMADIADASENLKRKSRKLELLREQVDRCGAMAISPVARGKTSADLKSCIKVMSTQLRDLQLRSDTESAERVRSSNRIDRHVTHLEQQLASLRQAARITFGAARGNTSSTEVDLGVATQEHSKLQARRIEELQRRHKALHQEACRTLQDTEQTQRQALVAVSTGRFKSITSDARVERMRVQFSLQ